MLVLCVPVTSKLYAKRPFVHGIVGNKLDPHYGACN